MTQQNGPWGKRPNNQNQYQDFDQLFKKGQSEIHKIFPGKPGDGWSRNTVILLILGLVVLWLASGFYKIQTGEEGVVLRFGKYDRTAVEGLNYHVPFPIEQVIKIDTQNLREEQIGFRGTASITNRRGTTPSYESNVLKESLMLTGDKNILDIHFAVQWRIKDAKSFIFNVRDIVGESTVKSAAESAMREVVGKTPAAAALAEDRSLIALQTEELLQRMLDSYESGIEIDAVQILKSDPPTAVIDAFRDVETARADKERLINQSEAYRNDIIPKARGEAAKIVQEAEAFKQETIATAEGEANRFLAVYAQYKKAKDVTRKRMYLETMEYILKDIDKIIIDKNVSGSGVVPFLPLSEINKKKQ